MERNQALEAYQKESYNQDIATYTFTVEASGVTSDERKELQAQKPGVNLHFLRYGIFNSRSYYKTSFIDVHAPEDERPFEPFPEEGYTDVANPNDPIELDEVFVTAERTFPKPSGKASHLNEAHYRITGINEGYIYIHEEGKDDFWLEFAVDVRGFLHPIYWEDNLNEDGTYKDVRANISSKTLGSFIIKEGTKIWVTLSQAQLSPKHLQKYANQPDDFDTLQSLVCNPIDKSSDLSERKEACFRSFKEFTASFTVYERDNAKLLQSKLDHIAALEYPENRDEEDTTLEDLFIFLEDPVQCANDLSNAIDSEIAWLKALTDTLKTGKSAYDVYDKIMGLPIYGDGTIKVPPEEAEEIGYIFALALTTYKFIYDNEELRDDFSRKRGKWYLNHGIDDQKLDKILGITLRKNQRDLINRLRNDLGNFLKSAYYNTVLKELKEGSYHMQQDAKVFFSRHLGTLVVHPTMVDRHLLLASEYKPYDDQWIVQVRKTITGDSDFKEINELLKLRIPIDEVEEEDSNVNHNEVKFASKFLSHFSKMTKAYAGVGALSETEIKLADTKVNYLSSISKKGKVGPFFRIDRKELLKKIGFEKYKKFSNSHHNHFTKTYAFLKIHEEVIAESKDIARRTGESKETSIYVQGRDRLKYSKQLEKMVQSPQYKSAVLVFEIWALTNAVDEMSKKGFSWVGFTDVVGAITKTTAASLKLAETMYDINGAVKPRILGKVNIARFSAAGSAFTVYAATKDMIKAVNASDNDAALAYSAAAGVSGYLLAVELGAVTLSTGPFIVVAAIGLLLYGLAYYLTDSELEKFFKHYPFSTQVTHPFTSHNPFLYARAMYKNRDRLITYWEPKYMKQKNVTYKHLFVRLTNLIAGGMLMIKGSDLLYSKHDRRHYLSDADTNNTFGPHSGYWTSMDIRISFASFLQSMNQIDYEVYLLQRKDLFANFVSYRIPNTDLQAQMIKQDNGTKELQLWLQVPKSLKVKVRAQSPSANTSIMFQQPMTTRFIYTKPDAYIAVLCKFKGNNETIFPLTVDDEHGYLYTEMQIWQRDAKDALVSRSHYPLILKKQIFLKAYPLQNPEL